MMVFCCAVAVHLQRPLGVCDALHPGRRAAGMLRRPGAAVSGQLQPPGASADVPKTKRLHSIFSADIGQAACQQRESTAAVGNRVLLAQPASAPKRFQCASRAPRDAIHRQPGLSAGSAVPPAHRADAGARHIKIFEIHVLKKPSAFCHSPSITCRGRSRSCAASTQSCRRRASGASETCNLIPQTLFTCVAVHCQPGLGAGATVPPAHRALRGGRPAHHPLPGSRRRLAEPRHLQRPVRL